MPGVVKDLTATGLRLPVPRPVTFLVGDFGSGKTEIAVNYSLYLAEAIAPRPVAIADLDLVNPYFRCREARQPLERAGVRVVVPAGGHSFADLPILLPEVKGLLAEARGVAILDVGGDAVGSRVLAALAGAVPAAGHDFWFVVNRNRPFNDTVDGCLATIRRIEGASKLRVTGLIGNTHLMQDTTPDMVLGGAELTGAVAGALGVPVVFIAVMQAVAAELVDGSLPYPLLSMRRLMVPPWLRRDAIGGGRSAFRPHPQ